MKSRDGHPRAPRQPVGLTVAGTDSGGGAGIAADLKTFAAHGVWGTCAVAAVTAQNTAGVGEIHLIPPAVVTAQIDAVATDIGVSAAKTGMLGDTGVVDAVAEAVAEWNLHPLVVDPVAVSTSGAQLSTSGGVAAVRNRLLPLADLVTPNLAEAAALAHWSDLPHDRRGMERLAFALLELGPAAVLVTGGHLPGADAADVLVTRGGGHQRRWFSGPRLDTTNTHGTGCVLAAAITARLARGEDLIQAIEGAKDFVTAAIAAGVNLGAGPGAVNPSGPCPP
ncbi:MAG TPA: bifunctional hydroxymethylpyrimidine kinase/phosphomethylpyrimidine kinase [Acidimicrobiia bacterium]|nr:bifunctional hydroxymethylpyrimidine kinase/phosphomethylpyrimidine kinase [Acidimicrobiia bacterium]